ncbi:hypothetical protein J28TS4_10310 [Paenibacillus lautus]|nr:hypothetical protein J28TS4_10310 [Paenibacillus lautus]
MKNHNDEKYALEEAAVNIFVDLYNFNRKDHIEVAERRECPDYINRRPLYRSRSNSFIL